MVRVGSFGRIRLGANYSTPSSRVIYFGLSGVTRLKASLTGTGGAWVLFGEIAGLSPFYSPSASKHGLRDL